MIARFAPARLLAEWLALGALVGLLAGLASALFLGLLDLATRTREGHEALVFALPLAGLVLGGLYERFGAPIRGGSNLVLERAHSGGPPLPLRMAPMVLGGTVLTHLFGGSAGREGTAVQMGAALADAVAARLRTTDLQRRWLLAAGIAGGFGSVFGTPIAGMIFGLEVIVLGRLEHHAMLPALTAALVGDQVTRALLDAAGHPHTLYPQVDPVPLTLELAATWVLFAAALALASTAFVELTRALRAGLEARVTRLPLRMAIGGAAVVGAWQLLGTSDLLGLGVPTIVRAFDDPSLPAWYFAAKILLTALTLGAGFLGGEVTPLFFVGATLGSLLARWTGVPLELGAGVGLAGVFAAASNAPLALSIMALELCGAGVWPHALIVAALAYVFAGHRGIYPSQRVLRTKWGEEVPPRHLG
jgi:H+/Cl- antiporter ClcA